MSTSDVFYVWRARCEQIADEIVIPDKLQGEERERLEGARKLLEMFADEIFEAYLQELGKETRASRVLDQRRAGPGIASFAPVKGGQNDG